MYKRQGYISTMTKVGWSASSDAALLKMGRGDRSAAIGFTSDRLSTVNNNGYMDYRLILSNLSANYHYTDVTLLDILPGPGDLTYEMCIRDSPGSGRNGRDEWHGWHFRRLCAARHLYRQRKGFARKYREDHGLHS